MKNLISFVAILFCSLSIPAFSQGSKAIKSPKIVHEIGTMPLRCHYIQSLIPNLDYDWRLSPNIYYTRHKVGSNFSWLAMVNFEIRNKPYYYEFDILRYQERNIALIVAPRYTFGQESNWRVQPFVQAGVFLGSHNLLREEDLSGFQREGSITFKSNQYVYGLNLSAGVKTMINKNITFSLIAATHLGGSGSFNATSNESSVVFDYSAFYPIHVGIGYRF